MKFLSIAFVFTTIGLPAAAQAQKMEPLPIVLPKPLFEGTPVPPKVPNMEKPAPGGVTNVALRKPVSSSDSDPVIGNLEMITDGVKTGADGSFVQLKDGVQSVVIDLESRHTIYAILIWHYLKEARAYADVVAQVADDPDFISNVVTLFNNDSSNAAGLGIGKDQRYVETAEGKLIDAKGVEARFVRLFSHGSEKTETNHYIEVEVYGKPLK
jgi:hypothetical protein